MTPEAPLIVQDTKKDERFFDNPLVTGAPHYIFNIVIHLVTRQGDGLGTLCVIDNHQRNFTEGQLET